MVDNKKYTSSRRLQTQEQRQCKSIVLPMIGEGSKPSSIIGRTKALAVARPFLGRAKIILFFVYSIANPK